MRKGVLWVFVVNDYIFSEQGSPQAHGVETRVASYVYRQLLSNVVFSMHVGGLMNVGEVM